ncbi:urease accessory protein UreF [Microbispora hainanensis]|uniref:urease accessory protein UreF n=1 Tax=Microbispora hainanensis TaxID=568844 RepID=UPI002E2CE896|nr:urease accessory UreF family protein [Microbispora hainanensis]
MNGEAALLLLADSRLPAGGHAHSGGVEEAVRRGVVTGTGDLARFLRGRLATAGLVTAALAAAACELAVSETAAETVPAGSGGADRERGTDRERDTGRERGSDGADRERGAARDPVASPAKGVTDDATDDATDEAAGEAVSGMELWRRLDAEADARTAAPAQREASRTQGRLLLRTARRMWPSAVLGTLARAVPEGPHHPVALGAAGASAGCTPRQAALTAAYTSVTAPATAAVRLLGLDPVTVHRLLADLAPAIEDAARAACAPLGDAAGPAGWHTLPGHGAPALDLLAEGHLTNPMKLFVS